MKNVLITGASGMVGRQVLVNCLKDPEVSIVTSLTRRPSGIVNPKLNEIIHQDFENFSSVEYAFRDQDVCFFCIGVYTGQVPAPEFRKITVDYTRSFAELLRKNNLSTRFCFLSGQGADLTGKSKILFAKEKGKAEQLLMDLSFSELYIFRPGYIYPEKPRKEPNAMYKLMRILYKPVASIYPNIGIPSADLALTMYRVGMHGGDKTIYENKDIRELSISIKNK